MKVVLIGAGNVAFQLGPLLKKKGHKIVQVYNPGHTSGKKLSRLLSCKYTGVLKEIIPDAEAYIVAIKDESIKTFLRKLPFTPALIAHTSGSTGLDVFPSKMKNSGVLYPVQTLSRTGKASPSEIPFCIEARNKVSLRKLRRLAKSMSPQVFEFNSEKRRVIHLAAVIVNNFTNYLFSLSSGILKRKNIPFSVLMPLIRETIKKIGTGSPHEVQTGPARRGDKVVINKHLEMLKGDPEAAKLYTLISRNIYRRYAGKK